MRVDCLTFLDPTIYRGGGENITSELLAFGRKRGHDVRVSSVRPASKTFHARPDGLLLFDDRFYDADIVLVGRLGPGGRMTPDVSVIIPTLHLTRPRNSDPRFFLFPRYIAAGIEGPECRSK